MCEAVQEQQRAPLATHGPPSARRFSLGPSTAGTPRFYRHALQQLDQAMGAMSATGVGFCIHLGDIIDFRNSTLPDCPDTGLAQSERALRRVLQHFDRLGRPTLHLLGEPQPAARACGSRPCGSGVCSAAVAGFAHIAPAPPVPPHACAGNHCLYNHPREELNRRLGISALQLGAVPHSYYTYRPAPGWRFVMLDGYDVSILGWPPGDERACTLLRWHAAAVAMASPACCPPLSSPLSATASSPTSPCDTPAGHPLHERAASLLEAHNPNENKNSAEGLTGLARRCAAAATQPGAAGEGAVCCIL